MSTTITGTDWGVAARSEEHTSELQSQSNLVCRLLLEKKNDRLPSAENFKLATVKVPYPAACEFQVKNIWMTFDPYIRGRMVFFFFNDTATPEIYTLSLHDALPISLPARAVPPAGSATTAGRSTRLATGRRDRKSTRLNSSHSQISYAVFCLKK